jgi:hypothetical protein
VKVTGDRWSGNLQSVNGATQMRDLATIACDSPPSLGGTF